MNRWIICLASWLIAASACDSIGSGSKNRQDPAKQEELARGYAADRERDLATVRTFHAWQDRIRTLDLVAQGLPPVPEAAPSDRLDAFRQVTGAPGFCERLPEQPRPTPDDLAREFRDHGHRYGEVLFPETFTDYQAHYLAERHMARLACLARASGPEHVRAFLELLIDDSVWVRYAASVHAINHGMDERAATEALRTITATRAGHAASLALTRESEPIRLAFDANAELILARGRLQGGPRRIKRPRTGMSRF